jgi:hypothetical protein
MARLRDLPSAGPRPSAYRQRDWQPEHDARDRETSESAPVELIQDAEDLVQKWLERRQRTVQSTLDLMAGLQPGREPGAVVTAWMQWYRTALDELAEDTSDNVRFGCRAATCYGSMLTDGMQRVTRSMLQAGDETRRQAEDALRRSTD